MTETTSIPLLHILSATPLLIATINAVVAAAIAVALALAFGLVGPVILLPAIAAFALVVVGNNMIGRREIRRGQAGLRPIFPSPDAIDQP